jgi:hypothetical protein
MDDLRQWHRLFGMSWTDFFTGLPVIVEMEKDLSLKQQWLDVALIRKAAVTLPIRLPDGFEDLGTHNLISFKSYQEALDGWALNEFIGHYVNYRKQVSPSMQDLLPESDFRLFAVSVRYPQGLAQHVPLERVKEGVYEVRHFSGIIRVVVVHQLPQEEHNAMLHLFSAKENLVTYGAQHYRPRSEETSTFLLQLLQRYRREGIPMPFTKEEFIREAKREMLQELSPAERLEGLSPEERLVGLSPKDLLARLSPEELLAGLSPEARAELRKRLQGDQTPATQ